MSQHLLDTALNNHTSLFRLGEYEGYTALTSKDVKDSITKDSKIGYFDDKDYDAYDVVIIKKDMVSYAITRIWQSKFPSCIYIML